MWEFKTNGNLWAKWSIFMFNGFLYQQTESCGKFVWNEQEIVSNFTKVEQRQRVSFEGKSLKQFSTPKC